MLRLRTPLALLVLTLLAGCLGRCGSDPVESPTPAPEVVTAAPPPPTMQPKAPTIDDHWDFEDLKGTQATFQALLDETNQMAPDVDPDADLRALEITTQLARTLGLQDDFDGANGLLDRVDKALATHKDQASRFSTVRVRAHLERGRLIRSSGGAKEEAREQFVEAWELARATGQDGLAVDAAHMVAIVDRGTDGEMEWALKGLQLAESSPQPHARAWRGSIYNNLGWTLHDKGDFAGALQYFDKQIAARKEAGKEPALRIALWTRARCLRSLKRHDEALAELNALVKTYGAAATDDGFVHEEFGENLLALGNEPKAKAAFTEAVRLLQTTWVAKDEPERLARLRTLSGAPAPKTP